LHSRPPARSILIYFAFLVITLAAYLACFDNSFRDDDFVFIRSVAECESPKEFFHTSERFAFYRPGALILFWSEYRLLGVEDAGAYLRMNFRFHIILTACLLGLFRRLGASWNTTLLAGGLFAVGLGHYGKQVMWASTGGSLFAMLLVVCAVWLAAGYMGIPANSPPTQPFKKYGLLAGTGILMMIAPAFHEVGLTASFLTVALLWLWGGTPPARRWLLVPVVLTVIAWALIYVAVARGYETYQSAADAVLRAPVILFRYLGFMLLPIQESSLVYGQPAPVRWLLGIAGPLHVILGAAVVAGSVYLLLRGSRRAKFLVVWLYVALIPFCFIGLPEGWLELRYVYFAAAPLCALISTELLPRFFERGRAWRAAAIALTVLATTMSVFVTVTLERQYDAQSRSPTNQQRLDDLRESVSDDN
jgi:hypothetical protein